MTQVFQIAVVPYLASVDHDEARELLKPVLRIIHATKGLLAHWQGEKHEELRVLTWMLLWEDYASFEAFFTSAQYEQLTEIMKPILFGRRIQWDYRTFVRPEAIESLANVVLSPAIEVATTHVVDGKVHGYLNKGVVANGPIMADVTGFQGAFLAPTIENPNRICLLINWTSVEAHHKDFEKTPAFKECISHLSEYYDQFVVPWHIVRNKLLFGNIPGQPEQ
ncbi:hypothetical protein FB567DRAFT_538298 [Paraphoma chrysanthemicola]|uniref:ABM domain-containing protein n=1 Tax=Paraphoma chrysanthemicola TaxID=798071 RepID=A0A8K0VT33_9PLEO|nr:hypothetical protein FB567DRAFT_538298 [Paraphoma chrysanthemicola]